VPSDIYEFSYTAKDPTVNVSALRQFAIGTPGFDTRRRTMPAPLTARGHITSIYTEVSSQPGRFLNDFRYLGFNQRKRETGIRRHDAVDRSGDGISMNYRWSQPGRTSATGRIIYLSKSFFRSRMSRQRIQLPADGQPLCKVHGEPYVSICNGDLFRQ